MWNGYLPVVSILIHLNLALMALILWRGVVTGWAVKYRWFTSYIAYNLLVTVALYLLNLVASSDTYQQVFYPSVVVVHLLMLGVLAEASQYGVAGRRSLLVGIGVAAAVSPFAFEIAAKTEHWFYIFLGMILLLQAILVSLGASAAISNSRLAIGINVKGILIGSGFMLQVHLIGTASILNRYISFESYQLLQVACLSLALAAFILTLWTYQPVRWIQRSEQTGFQDLMEEFRGRANRRGLS